MSARYEEETQYDLLPYNDRRLGRIWTEDRTDESAENRKLFLDEFSESEFGQELTERGVEFNLADVKRILAYAVERFGTPTYLPQFITAAKRLDGRGLLVLKPEPVVEADTRERDPQTGQFLGAKQLAEREYDAFLSDPKTSVQDVKNRKNMDPGFREWHLRTMQQQLRTDDPMVKVNNTAASQTTDGRYDASLIAFADKYRKMSMNEVRANRNPSTNPNGYVIFNDNLDRCFACGLL